MDHSELKTLEPEQRLLMGPGPVNVYPAVLRALSLPMLGQFDPQFIGYMDEVMTLYRQVYRTRNQWTFLVNGTARAGIEACLSSMISPGDRVLVPIFGRFGHLLTEIARRCQAEVINIETEWGTVFEPEQIADAIRAHQPRFVLWSMATHQQLWHSRWMRLALYAARQAQWFTWTQLQH